jgi:hypothetical protein
MVLSPLLPLDCATQYHIVRCGINALAASLRLTASKRGKPSSGGGAAAVQIE